MTKAEWISIVGVALILIAYFLGTFKKISTTKNLYYLMNAAGAGLACYGSYLIHFFPFVILEGIWCAISVYAIVKK